MEHQRSELMSCDGEAACATCVAGFKRRTPLVILRSAAPHVYILEFLQMKEEPAPLSSWFRHVGKLAVLTARPKLQNNSCDCVTTLHTGEGCFNSLMDSGTQNKVKITQTVQID